MSSEPSTKSKRPGYPKLNLQENGNYEADVPSGWVVQDFMGMKTHDAATGVYTTAISALGKSAATHANFASAMFTETAPRDAFEAMLTAQMTATYVAMVTASERLTYQTTLEARESFERSMTRLSRTYLAQMDALKKYRSKAQQVVRVERVDVHDGGQAIVGQVDHKGGSRG